MSVLGGSSFSFCWPATLCALTPWLSLFGFWVRSGFQVSEQRGVFPVKMASGEVGPAYPVVELFNVQGCFVFFV